MSDTITVSATLLVPLLALIIALAVDSVRGDDSILYRILVRGIGLAALGPIIIVALFYVLEPFGDFRLC